MKQKIKYNVKEGLIDSVLSTLLILITIIIIPAIISGINFLQPFIKAFEDIQITDVNYSKLRDPSLIPPDSNIIIFDVEQLSTQGLIMLIAQINNYQPKVLAIDLMIEPTENELENLALLEILKETKNLVLPAKLINPKLMNFVCDSIYYGNKLFSGIGTRGFTNLIDDGDKEFKTVRDFLIGIDYNRSYVFSFPVQIAKLFDESAFSDLIERGKNLEIINYRGNIKKFSFANGDDILNYYEDLEFINDKIVILGIDGFFRGYDLLEDLYFTPMNANTAGRTFPDMSQVTIIANIVSMILDRNYINSMPSWLSYLMAVTICFLTCLCFDYISKKNRKWYEISSLMIFVFMSIILLFFTLIIFDFYHYQLRLTEALFTIALAVFVYQIYAESLKPITMKIYRLLKKEL